MTDQKQATQAQIERMAHVLCRCDECYPDVPVRNRGHNYTRMAERLNSMGLVIAPQEATGPMCVDGLIEIVNAIRRPKIESDLSKVVYRAMIDAI